MIDALSTDLYQITMMAGYVQTGLTVRASFELFARRLPPHRKYLICAGLGDAIEYLEGLRFTAEDIAYLRTVPALQPVEPSFFDDYLPKVRFTGDVNAMPEGTVIFDDEPILQVTAPLPEAQLVETALLALISFQTSVASRASRVVQAAAGRPVVEFGTRRAHGAQSGALAARAAYLAGCEATSNLEAGKRWGIPVSGTMAHSWVLAHPTEAEAFRSFAALYGGRAVLLIDTYDTLAAVDQVVAAGLHPASVRLDSGDLGHLARAVRAKLDRSGLTTTQIFGSGDLDEHRIAELLKSGAPFDGFGVGSAISAITDVPSLSAVYKLASIEQTNGEWRGVMKRSAGKATLPGRKQVWRVTEGQVAARDVIGLDEEPAPANGRPLLIPVMKGGRRCATVERLEQARERARASLAEMPPDVADLEGERRYLVERSRALDALRTRYLA